MMSGMMSGGMMSSDMGAGHHDHDKKDGYGFGQTFDKLVGHDAKKTQPKFKLPYGVKEVCYDGNLCVVYFMAKS